MSHEYLHKRCYFGCAFKPPLHSFPSPNYPHEERFAKWKSILNEDIINRGDEYIHTNVRLCQRHFEEKYKTRGRRLTLNSYPTLHLCFTNILKCPKLERRPLGSIYNSPDEPPSNSAALQYNFDVFEDEAKENIDSKESKESCQVPDSIATQPNESSQSILSNIPKIEATSNDEDTLHSPSPSHSDVPEAKLETEVFSWQKSNAFYVERDDILDDDISDKDDQISPSVVKPKNICTNLNQIEIKIPGDPIKVDDDEENCIKENHKEYSCDHCRGDIIGYTCVQCEDYDLCGACETRLVHSHHYMLRVPSPRPFSEIKSVIAAIRKKIAVLEEAFRQNSFFSVDDWCDIVIKKEEDPFDEPKPASSRIPPDALDNTVPNADPQDIAAKQSPIKATSSFPTIDINIEKSHRIIDLATDAGGTHEVFEEYLDEIWLDESILENSEGPRNEPDDTRIVNKRERGRTKTEDRTVNVNKKARLTFTP